MRAVSKLPISDVSIKRGVGFEGRACGANSKESQCNLEDQTSTILDGRARIEKLAPGLGSSMGRLSESRQQPWWHLPFSFLLVTLSLFDPLDDQIAL
jgi:hypothetical protein